MTQISGGAPNGDESTKLVKSAERVADILELVGAAAEPIGAGSIASSLELPRSSVYGLLYTLQYKQLLERDGAGRYSLGSRLLALANSSRRRFNIGRLARPPMQQLARELQVTCNLGVIDGHNIVYVEKVQDYSQPVRLETYVGAAMPAHATAMGKVLVAEMNEADRQRWLENHAFTAVTARTRRSVEQFRRDLDHYHQVQYAVDNEEFSEGVTCVASAVRDFSGQVVAAVSLTEITSRLTAAGYTEDALGVMIQKTAASISGHLGEAR